MRWLLVSLLLCSPVLAHDHWIRIQNLTDPVSGESCCNANDCQPVLPGGVHEVRGGYLLTDPLPDRPAAEQLKRE